jgi:hypothetical protein
MKELGGRPMRPLPFTILAASSAICWARVSSPSSAALTAATLSATILVRGRDTPAASARSSIGIASGFPVRCRPKPSTARA